MAIQIGYSRFKLVQRNADRSRQMAAGKLGSGADIDQLRLRASALAMQFVRGNDCASFNGCFHASPPVQQLPN
jgi:hypothetical protein